MKSKRMLLWLCLLVLVLGIRWWDPLARSKATEAISAPMGRVNRQVALAVIQETSGRLSASAPTPWPVRATSREMDAGNAFLARGQVVVPTPKRLQAAVVPAPYVPPPQPEPIEAPPPLQVIGTWGVPDKLGVFLSGPQGTVLAYMGDSVMGQYSVQNITKQQLTLLQSSNQRVWNLVIPAAPSELQTWPLR